MNLHPGNPDHPDAQATVALERSLVADAAWLAHSVGEFCHFVDPEVVAYLLDYSDDTLSPNGLAHIARVCARALDLALEMGP